VAIVTLALGIGANTAVFTVINGVLLRPLPYADPDRLVTLLNGRNGRLSDGVLAAELFDITTQSGVFAGSAAFQPTTANLTGHGDPRRLEGADVTSTFFQVLGVTPAWAVTFVEADQADNAAGRRHQRRSLASARRLLRHRRSRHHAGRHAVHGDRRGAAGDGDSAQRRLLAAARVCAEQHRAAGARRAIHLRRGPLAADIDLAAANSAMATVANRLAVDFPRTNQGRAMTAVLMQERMVSGIRPALRVLLGAVMVVLLIACVNVANLLLARARTAAHARSRCGPHSAPAAAG
jgi:hypothetical protein